MKSKIEWTESSWNPSIGCDKISAGCKNCYAEIMATRLQAMRSPAYQDAFKFKVMPDRIESPLKVKKPFEFLDRVFETIRQTPRHTYQILTKRENILEKYFRIRTVPENVWLGVTVEMKNKKNRIDVLRNIDAKIRFLSIEPLLENLGILDLSNIHWVIVGGESGHKARRMKPEWAIDIQKQCSEQKVSFFFKQWGTWGADGVKRNKKANGRILLEREWNGNPQARLAHA